ncbi:PP2C family protein-serine/threonine phosphatase [Mycolicibacterium hodleri]|uniref:GAF domain-containing protein n=1 Tax=Mycolicibacterium hodleri TaxID=49897 RepID=A0A502E7W2_9MYCO|nr:GAF domain-containing SpoIIE family protein phosphatase [Mycolicibacterium hodleri]TPG33059.1 GAF domain-containing protein [Mycolicibacterium hodleri]
MKAETLLENSLATSGEFTDTDHARGMARLVQAVQELSLARSLPEVQRIVRTAARELTGCDGATFVLRDDGKCYYADEDAIAPLWKGSRFPLEACISGWAMLNRDSAVIPDIYRDARIPHEAYRPTFVKSLVMVPIRKLDPIGAIGNYWAYERQPSEREVSLLQALADATSIAMENVGVYSELENRVRDRTVALEQANEEIHKQTDRLTAGLDSAAAYVSSILPGELEGPVRVSSHYLPSQELAGDIFDYRWIDDDHLIAYLIDVSGHGIGPALLSVSVHNLLRSGSLPLSTLLAPDQVLAELNRLFQMDKHDGNYLTMWFGVYEMSSRTLRYASAGAPPVIALSPDAISTATELCTDDQPLAMFEDATYTSRSYTVLPGYRILLYSDGAYEDACVDGRRLNRTDFSALCARLAGSPLDDLVETLRALTPSGSFDDDCSLVRLEFD